MTDIRDIDDGLARFAYESGADPVTYADTRVRLAVEAHLIVMAGRMDNPASFPGYPRDVTLEALSRLILGVLLDIGWTPPDIDPPMPFVEGVPAGLDDLDEGDDDAR